MQIQENSNMNTQNRQNNDTCCDRFAPCSGNFSEGMMSANQPRVSLDLAYLHCCVNGDFSILLVAIQKKAKIHTD